MTLIELAKRLETPADKLLEMICEDELDVRIGKGEYDTIVPDHTVTIITKKVEAWADAETRRILGGAGLEVEEGEADDVADH